MPFHFETIPSTQVFLKEYVQTGQPLPHLDYALADVQTSGVGRMNRTWVSEVGNLFLSIWISKFSLPLTWLPHWVGVTVLESLQHLGVPPGTVQLKWPNDLVSMSHAKIAGILCEKVNEGVIAGIGVNLVTAPDLNDRETMSVHTLCPLLNELGMNQKLAQQIVNGLRHEPTLLGLKQRYEAASLLRPNSGLHWLDLHTQQPGEGVFLKYGEFGEIIVRDLAGKVRPLYSEEIKIIL